MGTVCFFAALGCLSDNESGSVNYIEDTNTLLVEGARWKITHGKGDGRTRGEVLPTEFLGLAFKV